MEKKAINQCYGCVFRESLSNSAHSKCTFEWKSPDEMPEFNKYGHEQGWYYFPFNYDPVWQESICKSKLDEK